MDIRTAIVRYCNYQERCHKEVKDKLYELGCFSSEVNEQLAYLIERGLLNEERYARAIARGKYRMKQWGRNKIKYQLRQNQVSDYCVKKAMLEIDEDEYMRVLQKLAEGKWRELKGKEALKKNKLYRYLMQKGYEGDLIGKVVKGLIEGD